MYGCMRVFMLLSMLIVHMLCVCVCVCVQEPSVLLYELACLTARACNAAGAVICECDVPHRTVCHMAACITIQD